MTEKILINDFPIETTKLDIRETNPYKVAIEFIVTHEAYHDVTTLLYKNDFLVEIPEESIKFLARISNYSTSVTNLYEKGAEGEFYLELIEK